MSALSSWVLLLASGGLGACTAAESGSDTAGSDVAPLVRSHVRVVDAEPDANLALTDGTLVLSRARYPDLANAAPGDVLVSGRGAGFLRRIRTSHVEGDKLVAETEPGSLEDVFEQVHVTGGLGDGAETRVAPATALSPQSAFRLSFGKLAVQGQRIALDGNSEIELVDGSFDFQPDLDFDLAMQGGKVTHAKVLATGDSDAHLHVRYRLKKPANLQSGLFARFGNGTPILESPAYRAVFWAGTVPIVVSVRARLLASWELLVGGDVSGDEDIHANGAVSAGLEYVDGAWRDLSSKSLSLTRVAATSLASHSVSGDITLTARLDVSFYELAGPYVALQAYTGLKHAGNEEASGWFFQDGLRGLAGAQVAVFGRAMAGYESVLFDVHEERALP